MVLTKTNAGQGIVADLSEAIIGNRVVKALSDTQRRRLSL